ncbi:hypothetical protein [Streptomyces alfalfae]
MVALVLRGRAADYLALGAGAVFVGAHALTHRISARAPKVPRPEAWEVPPSLYAEASPSILFPQVLGTVILRLDPTTTSGSAVVSLIRVWCSPCAMPTPGADRSPRSWPSEEMFADLVWIRPGRLHSCDTTASTPC